MTKLVGKFAKCKVLIVLMTPALYDSYPCLNEIYHGVQGKLKIIPIRIESNLPKQRDQWSNIKEDEADKLIQLLKVQEKFGKLNSLPSPPFTVTNSPEALQHLVDMVLETLEMPKIFCQAKRPA